MAIHRLPIHVRYLQWDEANESPLDVNELFDAMAEDLIRDGDMDLALQKAFRWGFQMPDGSHMGGLRDLMQRLRRERQRMIDQFDFNSIVDDIRDELKKITDAERATVQERQRALAAADADLPSIKDMLDKRQQKLDSLPPDAAGQINALQNYEFLNPEAQKAFDELVQRLQQQVADSLFKNLKDSLGGDGGAGSMDQLSELLNDINEALEQSRNGEPVDLDRLNNKWAQQLGGRVDSVEELAERLRSRMAASQALMGMLSPSQRRELQQLIQQAAMNAGVLDQLQRLRENLGAIPTPNMRQSRMHDSEQLSLDVATDVLEQASQMELLEHELRAVTDIEDLQGLDPQLLEEVLNDEDRAWLDQWAKVTQQLEDAGFATQGRRGLELTPRAIRRIGEHALSEIFSALNLGTQGDHDMRRQGRAGELTETSSPWQYGDPFVLDLPRTIMNGIMRNGPGAPVHLRQDDFDVFDREARTSTATVLLIDMSRSMIHNGCWDAAKRAALALDTLIRGKYPRDMLELVGFSATAHRLKMTELPSLEWNEYNVGTNLHHGLQIARELLRPEKGRNRQVIVITDGEPTAYLEDGEVQFNYPPTRETFDATLREVMRCTREGITINTFLLEQTPYMSRFIEDLMRINRGRVINASPNKLGSYVLKDFLRQRTVKVN
jgi:uncharacterized protein with von Willebrand factor type A (vWA) domain